MKPLLHDFWDKNYKKGKTGWDIGYPSPPIQTYIGQLERRDLKILIPGAGNAYEAEYLFKQGFGNTYVLDYSEYPLENLINRVPDFPKAHLLHQDFFDLDQQFDLILEQTFFCALSPDLRENYVEQIHKSLRKGGKLVGLLFNAELNQHKPPFGGNPKEYKKLFSPKFEIEIMETAYNSIKPRAGRELFIKMRKK